MEQKASRLDSLKIDRDAQTGGGPSKWLWGLGGSALAALVLIGIWIFGDAENEPASAALPTETEAQDPAPVRAANASLLDAA